MKLKQFLAVMAVTGMPIFAFAGSANAAVCEAIAGNLVANCGFETGNLSGWTFTPASSGSDQFVGGNANSGNFAWSMGAVSGINDTIAQTLTTIAGDDYNFSFFYRSVGEFPSGFSATWDGTTVLSLSDAAPVGYTEFTFTELATGSDTITLGGFNIPSFDQLDDVSVVDAGPATVPEPDTFALFGLGLAGLGLISRRRRKEI